MERKHNINLLLLSVLLLVTAACSTTKNLPEDETLYVGVKNIEILNEDKIPCRCPDLGRGGGCFVLSSQ